MRTRPLLAVLGVALSIIVAVGVVAVGVTPTPALAAPAGCVAASNGIVLACEYTSSTGRPLGAIGLLGDSVLLGSSPGMSTPSLPAQLATRGWGPIKMSTSLGMRTYNPVTTSASAYHVLGRWKTTGFAPRVIVVNLGANHFLDCTLTTFTTCQSKIVQLMDRIAALYPTATVWWAKTNARSLRTGAYDSGMLGWNKALDAVAAARPTKLVVWDWPKAIVDGKFAMDPPQIHPSGAAQYAKRSTLIADHVTAYTPAVRSGAAVVPPALPAEHLGFTVAPVVTDVFDSGATPVREFAPRTVDLTGKVPGDATAVALTLTVRNPSAAGWAWVYKCGEPGAPAPRVYVTAGQQHSVQALVRLNGGSVCVAVSNTTADTLQAGITLSLQGSFAPTTGDSFTLTSPPALATVTATAAPQVRSFTVGGAGTNAVAVAITVAGRTAGGTVTAYRCGDATVPTAFQLSYGAGETHTASAFVPATDGRVCLKLNSLGATLPSVTVGVLGSFSADPNGLRFRPITPTRVLDLRPTARTGGWYGRHVAQQVLPFTAGRPGTGIRAVSGTVTAYTPLVGGTYTAYARPKVSTAAAPPVPALQVRAGTTSAASLTTAVDGAGAGIALRSTANAITAFDVTGYWTVPPPPAAAPLAAPLAPPLAAPAAALRPEVAAANRLFMVSDSVGLGAIGAMKAAFGPSWQVTITGKPGLFTESLVKYVNGAPASAFGESAIVATGYNYPYWDPPRFDRSVDQMVAALKAKGVTRIYWVTVREVKPTYYSHWAGLTEPYRKLYLAYPRANDQLRAAMRRHPGLSIIDWASASDQAGLTSDAIHLNQFGAAKYSALARDIVVSGRSRLAAGTVTTVPVIGRPGIAADAAAATVTLTVTNPRTAGYLAAYSCDEPRPTLANLWFDAGQTMASGAVVPLGPSGSICVYQSTAAHVAVDLNGYVPATAGMAVPAARRALDTRTGSAPAATRVVRVRLAALTGTPPPPFVAMVNLTTFSTSGGDVRVFTCGGTPPAVPLRSVEPGTAQSVFHLVRTDANGDVCVTNSGTGNLVLDLEAAFAKGADLHPFTSRRLVDTATTGGPLRSGVERIVKVASTSGIPAAPAGAFVSLTMVPSDRGAVALYPCAAGSPRGPLVHAEANHAQTGAAWSAVDRSGTICLRSNVGARASVVVSGWSGTAVVGVTQVRVVTSLR